MSEFISWTLTGRNNERPEGVSASDYVEVIFRDGDREVGRAKTFLWLQFGDFDDVVAYRKVDK